MITDWEIIVLLVAMAVSFAALVPFVPFWAWYALTVVYALTRVVDILEHGVSMKRLAVAATSTIVAVMCGLVLRRQRRKSTRAGGPS